MRNLQTRIIITLDNKSVCQRDKLKLMTMLEINKKKPEDRLGNQEEAKFQQRYN